MGSDNFARAVVADVDGFNPRSHMGSDTRKGFIKTAKEVSIHAPTWGATLNRLYVSCLQVVSIHAPTWGATARKRAANEREEFQSTLPHGERPANTSTFAAGIVFQSTLPHGERLVEHPDELGVNIVSIHAPTWGATGLRWYHHGRHYSFNPRSHMGSDLKWIIQIFSIPCFNPRSHMGSDPSRKAQKTTRVCFNPRSHMGSD